MTYEASMFPVSPAKIQALLERMEEVGLREEEIEESFVRSGGKGGQNVNKVSTCVVLVHRPSGITVKCQQERSQAMNRYRARHLLADKLEEKERGAQSAVQQRVAKLQRQKRKRSKRAKEKMLADKRERSAIKAQRSSARTRSGE